MPEHHVQAGICQRDTSKLFTDMPELGGCRFQEFATNGSVLEQVTNFDLRALRTAAFARSNDFTQVDNQFPAVRLVGLTRTNANATHFCDGCQCFTTESHGL